MRACLFALLLAAIGAAATCGQTIEGPAEIGAGQPTWYSITNVPASSQAVWIPNSELQAGLPYIRDGHALLVADTPGKRSIVAIVAVLDADGRLQGLVPLSKEIEVTGEAPPEPFREPVSGAVGKLEGCGETALVDKPTASVRSGPVKKVLPIRRDCANGQCFNGP